MKGVSVNENGPERSCRASILASPATDTYLVPDFRNKKAALIGNHVASFCGTMFGACPACCLFGMDYAVFLYEDCLAYLGKFLGFNHQGHNSTRGADVSAAVTVKVAEAAVKVHPGLHYAGKSVFIDRRLEDVGGTGVDAEGACSAP